MAVRSKKTGRTIEDIKNSNSEYVMVIIPKPMNIIGDTETIVSVNGKMYQIQYDKPVMVPRNVAEVINQSMDLQAKIAEIENDSLLKPNKKSIADL